MTHCALDRSCNPLIYDLSCRFGVSTWLVIALLVIGEVCLPVANHFSISDRS